MATNTITFPAPGTALADPKIREGLAVLRRDSASSAQRAGVAVLESIAGKITVSEFRWLVANVDDLPVT